MATKKDPVLQKIMREHVTLCPICGGTVPNTAGKRGRPRVYDSPECAEYARLLALMEPVIGQVSKRLPKERRKARRSDLWYLANQFNSK